MTARWNGDDYWPEVDYARPPAKRPPIDWPKAAMLFVALIAVPFVFWSLVIALIWWAVVS